MLEAAQGLRFRRQSCIFQLLEKEIYYKGQERRARLLQGQAAWNWLGRTSESPRPRGRFKVFRSCKAF